MKRRYTIEDWIRRGLSSYWGHYTAQNTTDWRIETMVSIWTENIEANLKGDIAEQNKLVNNGENKGIDLHSTYTAQKYTDISKTGSCGICGSEKIKRHQHNNTRTDPIRKLNITRVRTVPSEEVTSEFMQDSGQDIMVRPVRDSSLQMASKAQRLNPKETNDRLTIKNGGKVKCTVCHKCFRYLSDLKIRARIHTGEKSYKCQVCSKSFAQKSHLTAHEWIHSGEKPYKCKVCNKSFAHKSNLTKHELIHSGEKPYTCQVCSKSFAQKSHLTTHERMHSGEKRYTCQVSSKSFAQKSHLTAHERIHSGEKPYKCKVCNKSFAHKSSLTKHELIHSGEKPYKCKICGKSFTQSCSLKNHNRMHSGGKPYKCKICGKSFPQSQSVRLRDHSRMHFGVKP